MTKAEALSRAQVELLRSADSQPANGERRGLALGGATAATKFSHPYFRVPFILIGKWR